VVDDVVAGAGADCELVRSEELVQLLGLGLEKALDQLGPAADRGDGPA
jgi:hypothetical protein